MKVNTLNKIVVILISFLLIVGMVCGIYFTFFKEKVKEINISNVAIEILNEARFEELGATSVDVETAKKMFGLLDEEILQIEGRIPMLNSYASMFIIVKSNPEYLDSVKEKLIAYGDNYQILWEKNNNEEQYQLVKDRIIGKKDNLVYIIIAKDAKKLESFIK